MSLAKALSNIDELQEWHLELIVISDLDEQTIGDFMPGVLLIESFVPAVTCKWWPPSKSPSAKPRSTAPRKSSWRQFGSNAARVGGARGGRQGSSGDVLDDGAEREDEVGSNPLSEGSQSGGSDVELHWDVQNLLVDWDLPADEDPEEPEHLQQMPEEPPPPAPVIRPPRYFDPRPDRVLGPQLGERRARTSWPKLHHSVAADGSESYLRLSQTAGCGWWDMRAVCGRHMNCSRSRSCKTARPLGELWAFLEDSLRPECRTKEQHALFRPDFATRLAARRAVAARAEARQWLQAEAHIPGCLEEPEY